MRPGRNIGQNGRESTRYLRDDEVSAPRIGISDALISIESAAYATTTLATRKSIPIPSNIALHQQQLAISEEKTQLDRERSKFFSDKESHAMSYTRRMNELEGMCNR